MYSANKERKKEKNRVAVVTVSIIVLIGLVFFTHYKFSQWSQEQNYSQSLYPVANNYSIDENIIPGNLRSWGDVFIINEHLDYFKYVLINSEKPKLEIDGLRKKNTFQSNKNDEIGFQHQLLMADITGEISEETWSLLRNDYLKMKNINLQSLRDSRSNSIDGLNSQMEYALVNLYKKKNIQTGLLFKDKKSLLAINIYRKNLLNSEFKKILEDENYELLWSKYFSSELGENISPILNVFDGSISKFSMEDLEKINIEEDANDQ